MLYSIFITSNLCIININCIGLLNLNYKHTQINEIIINYYWINALQ